MYTVTYTSTFKSQFKKFRHEIKVLEKLITAVNCLQKGGNLPKEYKDHLLTGQWSGYNEFHLFPDILIIYKKYDTKLVLSFVHIGSHATLFG